MSEGARPPAASITTLRILDVLLNNFAHGLTNGEVAKAAGISPSQAVHHVAALEAAGFAERVPETGRIRPSVRIAQKSTQIFRSLADAQQRIGEISNRIQQGA